MNIEIDRCRVGVNSKFLGVATTMKTMWTDDDAENGTSESLSNWRKGWRGHLLIERKEDK